MKNTNYAKIQYLEDKGFFPLLAKIGNNLMENYVSDIFYDIPRMLMKLTNGEDVTLFVANSRCDLIDRYNSYGEENLTREECFEKYRNDVDYVVVIHPNIDVDVQQITGKKEFKYRLSNFLIAAKDFYPNRVVAEKELFAI